jgi:DNA replication protein DnaC
MKHLTGQQWPATRQHDYGPPAFADPRELHFAADYGPHICARCWGGGWMRSEAEPGTMVRCGDCNDATRRLIGRCWEVSRLNPSAADPPRLVGLVTPDAAAKAQVDAAKAFAQRPKGWLTLYGAWGSGKTHLAEAIARHLLHRKIGTVMLRAADLFVYLGATERREGEDVDYEGRLKWLQSVPVLVVDELGKERQTDAVINRRQRLLMSRFEQAERGEGGATVLVSNEAPEQWPDPALASRARDARFQCLKTTDVDFRRLAR